MEIIPVIDIKNGVVVSAKKGERDKYQVVKSVLCRSSQLSDIVEGLLSFFPFKTIYIADLDAITGQGNNWLAINDVINKNQTIQFWVDAGQKLQDISSYDDTNYRVIIGTESQTVQADKAFLNNLNKTILSLDYCSDNTFSGPLDFLEETEFWPQQIIIMILARVGSLSGPDFEKLKYFCVKYPEKSIIAAGGVRNEVDLLNLKEIGVKHALVASALHSGTINAQVIKNLVAGG